MDTVHIVIQKERVSWLVSIMNWGLHCHWFDEKETALSNTDVLLRDYHNYYDFWHALAGAESASVCVLSIEDILQEFGVFRDSLLRRGMKPQCADFSGVIDEVPMSPVGRDRLVTEEDVDKMIKPRVYV